MEGGIEEGYRGDGRGNGASPDLKKSISLQANRDHPIANRSNAK
jgi:hypothetical protein